MEIRNATHADTERLVELFRGYLDFYEADPPDDDVRRMISAQIDEADERAFILVAENDSGYVVGFAHCQRKWSSLRGSQIYFLDDLFVDAEHRGGGAADALIEAIAERARAAGFPSVEWLTTPENKRAHKVYDRVGGQHETLREYSLDV